MYRFVIVALCIASLAPTAALAQSGDRQIEGYFRVGFSGNTDTDNSPELDLDPTIGFGARYVIEHDENVAYGPEAQFSFWRPEGEGPFEVDRSVLIDIGGFLKLRHPFEIADAPAEIYLLGVFGFAMSILDDDFVGEDSKMGFGLHMAAIAGFSVFFSDKVGGLFELGWMRHQLWQLADAVGDGYLNQGTMELGVIVNL